LDGVRQNAKKSISCTLQAANSQCTAFGLPLNEKILVFQQQTGNYILAGNRILIIQLLNSGFIDELQVCIHPVSKGKGLELTDQIKEQVMLKPLNTKILNSGASVFHYEVAR